jgi:hypothetical protein
MKSFLSCLIVFSCTLSLKAQEDTVLVNRENQLVIMLDDLRKAENDHEKNQANRTLSAYLYETLKLPGAFSYPFRNLKTIGFIDSPDGQVRIVNWNVEQQDQTHRYNCYILKKDERKDNVQIIELVDNSFMMPAQPDGILNANEWYGALYYKIVPMQKGSKNMYVLLGWDGNTSASNMKLIDVLYFSGNNAKLGSPIFQVKDKTLKRVFFEHSEKATMSLRYEEQYKRIIFDHLSPEAPGLEGFYAYYVPDLSLDAFMLSGNKWVLKEDVIGVNQGDNKKVTVYAMGEESGEIEKKEIKNKWIDPEGQNGPAGGIEHKAVTPEDEMNGPDKKKKKKENTAANKDKRDPSKLQSTYGKQPKKKKKKKN